MNAKIAVVGLAPRSASARIHGIPSFHITAITLRSLAITAMNCVFASTLSSACHAVFISLSA